MTEMLYAAAAAAVMTGLIIAMSVGQDRLEQTLRSVSPVALGDQHSHCGVGRHDHQTGNAERE